VKLIVGLGNPGKKYFKTRHNVGFDVVNALAEHWSIPLPSRPQYGSLVSTGNVASESCILALPQKYMNCSGQPIASLMGYFKISAKDLIVVHDELAFGFGMVRCKKGGGHGGHNGLRDLIRHVGNDFLRVRMGIGKPPPKFDQARYVLSRWTEKESRDLLTFLGNGEQAIEYILRDGIASAMNSLNVRPSSASDIFPSEVPSGI
jgi:PTH1 family peptidyl-tRNA hydrolase